MHLTKIYEDDKLESKNIHYLRTNMKELNNDLKCSTEFLFSNLDFEHFRYIEYKDFVLDLLTDDNNIYVSKDDFKGIASFKYLNSSFRDCIRGKNLGNLIIRNVLYNKTLNTAENNVLFYRYCLYIGRMMCNITFVKGECLYMHGISNTGKSVILEHFFTLIYGLDNIGLINFADKKYSIEQALNKKIVLMNEYKHAGTNRELMLKILDKSVIVNNVKYKEGSKGAVTGHSALIANHSPEQQKMDNAMIKRIQEVELAGTFDEKGIDYVKLYQEFPLVVIVYVYAFKVSINYPDMNPIDQADLFLAELERLFEHESTLFTLPV